MKGLTEAFKQNQEQILSGISGRKYPISYEKKFEDGTVETRVAYEVSVASMEIPSDEENVENEENENM